MEGCGTVLAHPRYLQVGGGVYFLCATWEGREGRGAWNRQLSLHWHCHCHPFLVLSFWKREVFLIVASVCLSGCCTSACVLFSSGDVNLSEPQLFTQPCTVCKLLLFSFQHHIKYQHLLKKKYVCPHPSCGRLFRLQKQLLRHAKHHTGTGGWEVDTNSSSGQ